MCGYIKLLQALLLGFQNILVFMTTVDPKPLCCFLEFLKIVFWNNCVVLRGYTVYSRT